MDAMNFRAWSNVIWGGSGGTFGSVRMSRTQGRSADRAWRHAEPTPSGVSTLIPSRQNLAAIA